MEYLTQLDKVKITVDIANKLRNFEGPNGKVNLFNEEYSFVKTLKKIFFTVDLYFFFLSL